MSGFKIRHLLQVLDVAYLFFSLVILSSVLWAGVGLFLVWPPLSLVLSELFPNSKAALDAFSGVYIAGIFASIGVRWGWKQWRTHLRREAQKSRSKRE